MTARKPNSAVLQKAKRLSPTREVLRELYLRSGNVCAFPGCHHRIIDDDGNYVGQLCHIEAAEEGGERFNSSMTDENRRSIENLLLMCYDHHIATNDVVAHPVSRMQEIKRKHEAKYSGAVAKIEASFADQTKSIAPTPAQSLGRINKVLGWKLMGKELRESAADYKEFAQQLSRVPIPTRELLVVIVDRSHELGSGELRVLVADIVHATRKGDREIKEQVDILEHHEMAWVDTDEDYAPQLVLRTPSGLPLWSDIKAFSEKTKLSLRSFIVDMRFDSLDA